MNTNSAPITATKMAFGLILFLFAFGERVLFDFGPNFELITTTLVLTSAYLGRKDSLWLTLAVLVTTDLILGNTNIFVFTWSGFLIPALVVSTIFRNGNHTGLKQVRLGLTAGIGTTAFFFLWTNFGVWLLSGMYPNTAAGLFSSYINALPFLRMQAMSTIVFVPLGPILTETIIAANKRWQIEKRISQFPGINLRVG